MGHVHIKDKRTGHEYVVADHLFDAEVHDKTGKPVRDAHGDLAAPKFRVRLGDATPTTKQGATKASDKSGQKAETDKE